MENEDRSGRSYAATISQVDRSQIALGDHNVQTQTIASAKASGLSEDDLAALKAALDGLKQTVQSQAPEDKMEAALERVDELQQAVTAGTPDLSTMEYVKGWFAKHLPGLAGMVASIVVHPIVGKLVEAAGDSVASEFRRRFGAQDA